MLQRCSGGTVGAFGGGGFSVEFRLFAPFASALPELGLSESLEPLDLALLGAALALVGQALALVAQALALVSRTVAAICLRVPHGGLPVARVRFALALADLTLARLEVALTRARDGVFCRA